jgi:hypothetical protein
LQGTPERLLSVIEIEKVSAAVAVSSFGHVSFETYPTLRISRGLKPKRVHKSCVAFTAAEITIDQNARE